MLRDAKPTAKDKPDNMPLDLMNWLNHARTLMAYDRKLKNAVAKSIIDLFKREKLAIGWAADANHQLVNPVIKNTTIKHLGGAKLDGDFITENMHDSEYLALIRAMLNIPV